MKPVTLDLINDILQRSRTIGSSGHPFLDQRWNNDTGRNSCYRRQYYRFCQLLAKEVEPKLIVELGIDEGDCCGHWASGAPAATVIGVDVHKDGESPADRCKQVAGVFSNFNYWRGWTWDVLPRIAALNQPIDILFIDSWHEQPYLAKDWNDYSKLLHQNSLVLIDDLQMGGVSSVFNELPYPKVIDNIMNPAVPIGILLYNGKPITIPFEPQEYMPEYRK